MDTSSMDTFRGHEGALLAVDPDTLRVKQVNRNLLRQLEVSESEVIGVHWTDLFGESTEKQVQDFAADEGLPLLTIDKTELQPVGDLEESREVKLNIFRWETDNKRLLVEVSPRESIVETEEDKNRYFNHLLYHFPETIYFKDLESRFLLINDKQAEMLGVDEPEEAVGLTDFDFFPEEEAEKSFEDEQRIIESGEPLVNEREQVTDADGVRHWVSTTKVPLKNEKGEVVGTMGITRNIDKQKQLEEENQRLLEQERSLRERIEQSYEDLQIQKNQFQGAFEKAGIGMALVDTDGYFMRVNDSLCQILGYSSDELREMSFQELTHPEDLEKDLKELDRLLEGEVDSYTIEKRYYHKEGDIIWAILSVSLVPDKEGNPLHFVSQVQDITERKEYEQKMDQSLEEKKVLLEEIHHRVKNNLASVSGILELQTYNTDDIEVRKALQDAQSRIYTMALVHEQLYQHDSLSNILLGEYVQQLAETINNSLNTEEKDIQSHVESDRVPLSVTQAVPCGLILNELITNAYKHGFEGKSEGNIWITIHRMSERVKIEISDDGVGLPDDFSFQNQDTLGMNLINTLIAQLDADVSYENEQGAKFSIVFPLTDK